MIDSDIKACLKAFNELQALKAAAVRATKSR